MIIPTPRGYALMDYSGDIAGAGGDARVNSSMLLSHIGL
jgi:hypothetical protein